MQEQVQPSVTIEPPTEIILPTLTCTISGTNCAYCYLYMADRVQGPYERVMDAEDLPNGGLRIWLQGSPIKFFTLKPVQ